MLRFILGAHLHEVCGAYVSLALQVEVVERLPDVFPAQKDGLERETAVDAANTTMMVTPTRSLPRTFIMFAFMDQKRVLKQGHMSAAFQVL